MSGSSLDGLDIAYSSITYVSGKWEFEILLTDCIPYPADWKEKLKDATRLSVPDFLRLHTAFGRYCGEQVNHFIEEHELKHKVFFIASHGHTVWHEPSAQTSIQIGDGASIAAQTGYTTISDLRNMDMALAGQGAPVVPVADQLLFADYDFCLNLGGIANITVNAATPVAFDICPANQLLDFFAHEKGMEFDEGGRLAQSGNCNTAILEMINGHDYYHRQAPKSLSNHFSQSEIIPALKKETAENALFTAVAHIAMQISAAIAPYCQEKRPYKMLITGGGALNEFLISQVKQELKQLNLSVECIIPDEKLIHYKEALAMSLMAVLRWREEENVFASVTGASRNSIGGAVWLGA
jgi:anhydro-N-acetylmuramic acid kinase